jgi:hypothetical protein
MNGNKSTDLKLAKDRMAVCDDQVCYLVDRDEVEQDCCCTCDCCC